jgi:hypothetical protein
VKTRKFKIFAAGKNKNLRAFTMPAFTMPLRCGN